MDDLRSAAWVGDASRSKANDMVRREVVMACVFFWGATRFRFFPYANIDREESCARIDEFRRISSSDVVGDLLCDSS